jgi:hypothetical protein
LKKLIGFHLLYYAFDREKLINFRPNEGDFRHGEERAHAVFFTSTEPKSGWHHPGDRHSGQMVNEDHQERFLPVFSYRMFQTKQISAEYNYEYFNPGTPWDVESVFNDQTPKTMIPVLMRQWVLYPERQGAQTH